MEEFLGQIDWVPTLIAFGLSFGLGMLWYSPVMFLKPWLAGLPSPPKWQAPMWMPMLAQAGSTLFLAIVLNILLQTGQLTLAILTVFTIAGFLKASGFYTGKTKFAVSVEVGYVVAMGVIMWLVYLVL